MSIQHLDPFLVVVLLLNFLVLSTSKMRVLIYAVAFQGALLGALYPIAHEGIADLPNSPGDNWTTLVRLTLLTLAIVTIKGIVIPQILLRRLAHAEQPWDVESLIGFVPTLLIGAIGTSLIMVFANSLPLKTEQSSSLVISASLATCFSGFLVLITRKEAAAQVLGYIVLENGIFIFGLLLIEAVPLLVEFGVVLDLFVGVFVMGIIIHHVIRAFPAASSEHLSVLKE